MEVVASLSQGRTALRSAACLHTNQSRSYLNHLVRTLVEAKHSTIILQHKDTELHCQIILGMETPIHGRRKCGKLSLKIMRLQTGRISAVDQPSTSHLPNTFHSLFPLICSLSSSSPCLARSFCSPFRTLTSFQFLISAFLSIAHLFLCSHCRQLQYAIADLTTANNSSYFLG